MSDNTIYHYTDLSAFENILSQRKLRLYNIADMQDKDEFTWFRKILLYNKNLPNNFKKYIDAKSLNSLVFVASFSKSRDLLSQWSRYADNHSGVCIGFDFSNHQYKNERRDNLEQLYFKDGFESVEHKVKNNPKLDHTEKQALLFILKSSFLICRLRENIHKSGNHDKCYSVNFYKNLFSDMPIYPMLYSSELSDKCLINDWVNNNYQYFEDNIISENVYYILSAIIKNNYFSEEMEYRMIELGDRVDNKKMTPIKIKKSPCYRQACNMLAAGYTSSYALKRAAMDTSGEKTIKDDFDCLVNVYCDQGRLYIEKEFFLENLKEIIIASRKNEQRILNICRFYGIRTDIIKYSKAYHSYL